MIKQHPSCIRSYSSEYSSRYSGLQVTSNLCGRASPRMMYGDHQHALMFRFYDEWECQLPAKCNLMWGKDTDNFIECVFTTPVIPNKIEVYECFMSGSITRISGVSQEGLVSCYWQGKPTHQQRYRVFSKEIATSDAVSTIIIETSSVEARYYSQIEAVLLTGVKIPDPLANDDASKKSSNFYCHNTLLRLNETFHQSLLITMLPKELLLKIFFYLKIDDICRASRVNKLFLNLSYDPSLNSVINLKPMFLHINDKALEYFASRGYCIKSLNLSWLGVRNKVSPMKACELINSCWNLVDLRLSGCSFISPGVIQLIGKTCTNLKVYFNLTFLCLTIISNPMIIEKFIKMLFCTFV